MNVFSNFLVKKIIFFGGTYAELFKLRLSILVLFTTFLGYFCANPYLIHWGHFLLTFAGISLIAWGANASNQIIEKNLDLHMTRTQQRPLPSGKLSRLHAWMVTIGVSLSGFLILRFYINALSAWLGLLTWMSYVVIYTPLKRKTPYSTVIGAFPGALPPMIGWTAVYPTIEWPAYFFFLIIFFWQMPHFLAISWIYKEDYQKAGFPMTTVLDSTGIQTVKEINIYSIAMILATLLPTFTHLLGIIYTTIMIFCNIGFLYFLYPVTAQNLNLRARSFFLMTIIYLFLISLGIYLDLLLISKI